MVRMLIASMVAAVAVFLWGAATWMGGVWDWGVPTSMTSRRRFAPAMRFPTITRTCPCATCRT